MRSITSFIYQLYKNGEIKILSIWFRNIVQILLSNFISLSLFQPIFTNEVSKSKMRVFLYKRCNFLIYTSSHAKLCYSQLAHIFGTPCTTGTNFSRTGKLFIIKTLPRDLVFSFKQIVHSMRKKSVFLALFQSVRTSKLQYECHILLTEREVKTRKYLFSRPWCMD